MQQDPTLAEIVGCVVECIYTGMPVGISMESV